MPYLMRRLVVDELQVRATYRIIRKYLAAFEEGEVSLPNFSHYNKGGEHAIRLRILYSTDAIVKKAEGVLNSLRVDNDINQYLPQDCWCYKDNVSAIDRSYCVLSYKCTDELSKLNDFSDITENNLVSQNFFVCFLVLLFQDIGIDFHFRSGEIQRVIEQEGFQDMITGSIEAVTQNVDFNYDDFTNPYFFKRFRHMLLNNLLVHPDGEDRFNQLFYRRNRKNNESEEETEERFCKELVQS